MEEQRRKGELGEDFHSIDDRAINKRYPSLSRDTGGKILDVIADAKHDNPIFIRKVKDALGFAIDFLFCEWMYVIDLDANRLEVYKGGAYVSDSEAARSRFVFFLEPGKPRERGHR